MSLLLGAYRTLLNSPSSGVVYLLRDEFVTTGGFAADLHGTNLLTANGGAAPTASGKVGYALQCTAASSQYLSIADNASLSTGDVDFWVAGWVWFDSSGVIHRIAGKGPIGSVVCEYSLIRYTDDKIYFAVANNSVSGQAATAATVSASAWHFVIAWHDSVNNTVNVQVDGGSIATVSYSGGSYDGTNVFELGRDPNGSYLNGRLDSVAFGKSPPGGIAGVISALATSLYNAGSGKAYSSLTAQEKTDWGLVSWWDFEPLASPRACEPGPGTLTLVQTDGQFSVSGGKMAFPAQASPVTGDQGLYGAGLTRSGGRVLFATIRRTTAGAFYLGWMKAASLVYDVSADCGFNCNTSNSFSVRADGTFILLSATADLVADTDYQLAIILRAGGAFYLVKGGTFTNWTLVWIEVAGTTTPVYPAFSNYNAVGTLDRAVVTDLPAPWTTDFGIATQRLAGSVAAGTAFTHTANCILEWTQTTLGNWTGILFRQQDATNNWLAEVGGTGNFILYEQVAGSFTIRASATGVVSAGDRVVIVADGTTIRGYSNNVLRWTYSSASNFQAQTTGSVRTANFGGTLSDLITWPRNVDALIPAGV